MCNITRKQKNTEKGIVLIALIGIIALILAIAFTTIYFVFYKNDVETEVEVEEFGQSEIVISVEKKEIMKNLKIDKRIVSDLTNENIPVPNGYKYLKGNTESGIIIECNETKKQFLFIPYNANAGKSSEDYYKNVTYNMMDMSEINSIKKYGGFYVSLNSSIKMEDLKTVNNDNYKFQYEQLKFIMNKTESVNAHLLYKEEIAQIEDYLKNNEIDLGENTIGVQAITIETASKINEAELQFTTVQNVGNIDTNNLSLTKVSNLNIKKTNNNTNTSDYVYMHKTTSNLYGAKNVEEVEIPVPSGFLYKEESGVVKIVDESNNNLTYIWVPLQLDENITKDNLESTLKDEFWKNVYLGNEKYANDSKAEDFIKNSISGMSEECIKSMIKYGGFYLSEAELSTNTYGVYTNKPRLMTDNSVQNTEDGGQFIRANGDKKDNKSIVNKFEQAIKKTNNNTSVVPHLMYGVEYDAALLWIKNTNDSVIGRDGTAVDIHSAFCYDSTKFGKYEGTYNSTIESFDELTSFNGIWGLGGNLAEFTHEIYKKDNKTNYIVRGGSYRDNGSTITIGSRTLYENLYVSEEDADSIGIRTALYINPNIEKIGRIPEGFEYNPTEYQVETHKDTGVTFKLTDNLIRFINHFEGEKIYKNPRVEQNKVIKNVGMAEQLVIVGKEIVPISKNGKIVSYEEKTNSDIIWAKVKIDDKNYGYINANKLTNSVLCVGETQFVINENNETKRYYESGLEVYSSPVDSNDESLLYKTAYSGVLSIIGKSTDHNWIIYKIDDDYYYVKASELKLKVDTYSIDNKYTFIKENNIRAWTVGEPTFVYTTNEEKNEFKKTQLNYSTEIKVTGVSIDNSWLEILYGNEKGFVKMYDVSVTQPSKEGIKISNLQKNSNVKFPVVTKSSFTIKKVSNYQYTDLEKLIIEKGEGKIWFVCSPNLYAFKLRGDTFPGTTSWKAKLKPGTSLIYVGRASRGGLIFKQTSTDGGVTIGTNVLGEGPIVIENNNLKIDSLVEDKSSLSYNINITFSLLPYFLPIKQGDWNGEHRQIVKFELSGGYDRFRSDYPDYHVVCEGNVSSLIKDVVFLDGSDTEFCDVFGWENREPLFKFSIGKLPLSPMDMHEFHHMRLRKSQTHSTATQTWYEYNPAYTPGAVTTTYLERPINFQFIYIQQFL